MLLTLALFAGLSGCGPAPSDNATSLDSSASIAGQHDGPEAAPLAPSPAPLASRPAVPDWIAKDLASPEVQVRLKAIDTWGQSAPNGSVDPLIQALEDTDEQVQARALELIVQDWAREQATKP